MGRRERVRSLAFSQIVSDFECLDKRDGRIDPVVPVAIGRTRRGGLGKVADEQVNGFRTGGVIWRIGER